MLKITKFLCDKQQPFDMFDEDFNKNFALQLILKYIKIFALGFSNMEIFI